MKSKKDHLLELFFNYPTKQWHFEEILTQSKLARSKTDQWLKRFRKEKLITRIKEYKKMPYYIANYSSANYKNNKKIYALQKLHNSGLLNHLSNLPNAQSVILFGSFSRSDWYNNSDIDIFIYGDTETLKIAPYELKLHRDIQLFIAKNPTELQELGTPLLQNIIKGNIIKGNIDFVRVEINA